jgi:hypothetical protein
MTQHELIEMAKTIATNQSLDPALICAVVEQSFLANFTISL